MPDKKGFSLGKAPSSTRSMIAPDEPPTPAPVVPPSGDSTPDILRQLQSSEDDKRRDRVRIELSQSKAEWLLGIITTEVRKLDIDSADFQTMYTLYSGIKKQLEQMKTTKGKSA